MKLLSFQEENFLLQPNKFNRNYQYVLIHRIKQKMKDAERDINFVRRHEKALLRIVQKDTYDDKQEIEKFKADRKKEMRHQSRLYFTPNLKTILTVVNRKLGNCLYPMEDLEKYLTWDKFIQKHKSMDEEGKQAIDEYIKRIQDVLQKYANELDSLRKNLFEGYLLSSNDF